MNIGDRVRVLAPFSAQLPDTYQVVGISNEGATCRLAIGGEEQTDIDVVFLERVQ